MMWGVPLFQETSMLNRGALLSLDSIGYHSDDHLQNGGEEIGQVSLYWWENDAVHCVGLLLYSLDV